MIRTAVVADAKEIQSVVNNFARKGEMLSLSLNEVYEKLFEYVIYEENSKIIGVCALHPMWDDIAEIRSLAVSADSQLSGIGKKLVEVQLERAKSFGFKKIFALTYREGFFHKLGFRTTLIDEMPKKVWTDCMKCVKYPNCDEIAVVLNI